MKIKTDQITIKAKFTDIVNLLRDPSTDWDEIWKRKGVIRRRPYDEIIIDYVMLFDRPVRRKKVWKYIQEATGEKISNQALNRYFNRLVEDKILKKVDRGYYQINPSVKKYNVIV